MPQWSWIAWVLVNAIANLPKVAEKTKPINLAQPALFVAKKGYITNKKRKFCHNPSRSPTFTAIHNSQRYRGR